MYLYEDADIMYTNNTIRVLLITNFVLHAIWKSKPYERTKIQVKKQKKRKELQLKKNWRFKANSNIIDNINLNFPLFLSW